MKNLSDFSLNYAWKVWKPLIRPKTIVLVTRVDVIKSLPSLKIVTNAQRISGCAYHPSVI